MEERYKSRVEKKISKGPVSVWIIIGNNRENEKMKHVDENKKLKIETTYIPVNSTALAVLVIRTQHCFHCSYNLKDIAIANKTEHIQQQ